MIVVGGVPVHHYVAGDRAAEAYARVVLVHSGMATQVEVARALGCSERTVRRDGERYQAGGMAGLVKRPGWCPGRRRLLSRRARLIGQFSAGGMSNRQIAVKLGVTERAIRKQVGPSLRAAQRSLLEEEATTAPGLETPLAVSPAVEDAGPQAPAESPGAMPAEAEAETTLVPMSLDVEPGNRVWDRLLACFGLLDDARPVFGDAKGVVGAGVLCGLPVLVASGILELAHKLYGEIGPAFYGTRTTLLTLLLMALGRIKRLEGLKEHDPQVLGRILGLDRAPEVKTVRRKLTRLASYGKAWQLGLELARLRVQTRGQLMGFLYIDGHVRTYHGKREIPKTHVARMRLAMPATTDYWVNDVRGDPLLVMTAAANAGMVKMLPTVLDEVRPLLNGRRVTIVFDRGGWSPQQFQKLLPDFDILTYRKGKARHITEDRFVLREATLDGRTIEYRLHDQAVRFLRGRLRLRQVTRLGDDGHQTNVLTSRWDLADIEVAYRMFERWRQENFFKYMREEFLLDALVDYHVAPDDPTRTVPNPERRVLDAEIRAAREELAKLEQAYGAAAIDNPESRRRTMRGFKIALGKVGQKLRRAREHVAELVARRRPLPARVEVRDRSAGAVVKLAAERKHLTDLVKMVAYQAESDLLALLAPHYARADHEGRTLLHELFATPGDLAVANGELRISLHPLSSPHRTAAAQALCQTLSSTDTVFPGCQLKIRLAMQSPPQIGLAFPGPRQTRSAPQPDTSQGR